MFLLFRILRLYRSQWIQRWGKETALKLDAEIRAGYETFKSLVGEVPCDAQPGGHFYVAHREKKMDFLRNEAKVMREVFGYDTRMLSAAELRRDHVDESEACGAMHEPDAKWIYSRVSTYIVGVLVFAWNIIMTWALFWRPRAANASSPFTVDSPTRRPVKLPGPSVAAIRSSSRAASR